MSIIDNEDQNKTKNVKVKENIEYILFYSLSLTVALGFNNIVISIFDSFPNNQHIIVKTTYVMIMFTITIFIAYYMGKDISS